jgi:hypothetical protein
MQVGVSNTPVMGAFDASAVNFNVTKRPHPIALHVHEIVKVLSSWLLLNS